MTPGRSLQSKTAGRSADPDAMMARRGRTFHCQIIGTGELAGDLRAQIAHPRAGTRGLEASVELLGPRPQNELRRYLQARRLEGDQSLVGFPGKIL